MSWRFHTLVSVACWVSILSCLRMADRGSSPPDAVYNVPTSASSHAPHPSRPDLSWPNALDADKLAVFLGSPEDDVPQHRGGISYLYENRHYVTGNEPTLDVFYDAVSELGGGYMGVGSDQAYLFMDWARVELAWLIDYDPLIQDVHELHRLFFLDAEEPRAFMHLWSLRGRAQALERIEAYPDDIRMQRLRKLYLEISDVVYTRLEHVRRRMTNRGVPCYLEDLDSYEFIRGLLRQGRVRPMLVNLLDTEGVQGIARSAKALGVSIRVLYLSNAEQYWESYSEQYRRNIAALPFDDQSLLLRTGFGLDYTVQAPENYLRWLAAPCIGSVYQIVEPRTSNRHLEQFQFREIYGEPQHSRACRRHRAQLESASTIRASEQPTDTLSHPDQGDPRP